MIFFTRARDCVLPLLRAIDILACAVWLSLLYPLGLADKPTGREMISSYIGAADINGQRWARPVAAIIDRAAMLLGDKPFHCMRSYLNYRGKDDA